jgi:endonuclease G
MNTLRYRACLQANTQDDIQRYSASHALRALLMLVLVCAMVSAGACGKRQELPQEPPALVENFDAATKGNYAAGEVKLSSGRWALDDAMIGSEQNDQKRGAKSLRLRNNGSARMLFDAPQGAKGLVLSHAVYAKDKSATFEVRYSTDGGTTWNSAGTSSSSTAGLQTEYFAIAAEAANKPVRFEIRKTDGTPNRLNIDDVGIIASGGIGSTAPNGSGTANDAGNDKPSQNKPSQSAGGATDQQQPAPKNLHLAMGIPTDADPSDDYLMEKPQYALSYNNNLRCPNWVSSNLNASYFGDVPRFSGKFMPDMQLPPNFYKVRHEDYSNSGYDRGHLVRSEERTATPADNEATFLTTNLLPQFHDLNAGPWLRLEEECQRLAVKQGKELYIICGGIFSKNPERIGRGGVAVPSKCFKIVVVLERGQKAKDVTPQTRVIAVIMPNVRDIKSHGWQQYATTVDDIERQTGYDFLNALPVSVQQALESRLGR